jgi:23S rRNA (cytosine1962-C5)-methyltransferase
MKKLFLLKHHQKRLLQGHPWIYSNEIDNQRSPLKDFIPGEIVQVCDAQAAVIGVAYVNPHSLISARMLTREFTLAADWIFPRIQQAFRYRQQFYTEPYYRLVYGESDGLPGLIIDRYGDDFVTQVNTVGMESQIDSIRDALIHLFHPRSITLRADNSIRELEQLPKYIKEIYGEVPEVLTVVENQAHFEIPKSTSQKTGWFYDHRENRAFLQKLAKGKTVLDVFSYLGGWGIEAACAGASEVLCVDASLPAMLGLQHNARLNHVEDKVKTLSGDAFEVLTRLKQEGVSFDMIVLDPPAFIKRKKDMEQGLAAYFRVNQQALKLLRAGGILVSASCSHHLLEAELLRVIAQSLARVGKSGSVIRRGQAGVDHPRLVAMPETDYLKTFFIFVS